MHKYELSVVVFVLTFASKTGIMRSPFGQNSRDRALSPQPWASCVLQRNNVDHTWSTLRPILSFIRLSRVAAVANRAEIFILKCLLEANQSLCTVKFGLVEWLSWSIDIPVNTRLFIHLLTIWISSENATGPQNGCGTFWFLKPLNYEEFPWISCLLGLMFS